MSGASAFAMQSNARPVVVCYRRCSTTLRLADPAENGAVWDGRSALGDGLREALEDSVEFVVVLPNLGPEIVDVVVHFGAEFLHVGLDVAA